MTRVAKAGVSDASEFSRARILSAALREFGQHGYRGARIDAVARRAGVPRGLIAYYFGTKEGLFRAVADQRAEHMQRVQQQLGLQADDPFAWTLSLFDLNEPTLDWVHLLIWEALDWEPHDATTSVALEDDRREFWAGRVDAVRAYQAQGSLPAHIDSEQLTFFLYVLGLYPYLVPQIAYLVTGHWPSDDTFQTDFKRFVQALARRMRSVRVEV